MMNAIDAKNNSINDVVYLVTDAVGAPIINRSKSACAVFESFLSEGAVYYRVCGPIPRGHYPSRVEYFTRTANQSDNAPWDPCDGDGCQGEQMQFQPDTATLCGQFRLWKHPGEHRDVMVKVTLSAFT